VGIFVIETMACKDPNRGRGVIEVEGQRRLLKELEPEPKAVTPGRRRVLMLL
jgi:hypothetical protein